MKQRLLPLFAVAFAFAALAQEQTTPRKFEGHVLGETVEQFESIAHVTVPPVVCLDKYGHVKKCDARRISHDESNDALRGRNKLYEQDRTYKQNLFTGAACAPLKLPWLLRDRPVDDCTSMITYTFLDGKLVRISMHGYPSQQGDPLLYATALLIKNFGKPTVVENVPYQNVFGARINTVSAAWGNGVAFLTQTPQQGIDPSGIVTDVKINLDAK